MVYRMFLFLGCLAVGVQAETQELTPLVNGGNITFVNGHYTVIHSTELLVSSDLRHWAHRPLVGAEHLAYGLGIYVILSRSNLWTSTDLVSFVQAPDLGGEDLIFDGSRFLIAGPFGIRASLDGLTWTYIAQGTYTSFAQAGGRVVAVGGNVALSEGQGFSVLEQHPANLTRVAALPGTFVARNRDGWVTVSSDGIDWSEPVDTGYVLEERLFAARGKFYAQQSFRLLSSTNGTQWTEVGQVGSNVSITSDATQTLVLADELGRIDEDGSLVFLQFGRSRVSLFLSFNDVLIAARESGIYTSTNGTDWTRKLDGFYPYARAQSEDMLILSDGVHLFLTADGLNWQTIDAPTGVLELTWSGDGFVLSNNYSTPYYSPDGVHWSPREATVFTGMSNNGKVVLGEYGSQIWRTTDLIVWEPTGLVGAFDRGVFSHNGRFLIYDANYRESWLSPDGVRFERKRIGEISFAGGYWRNENSVWQYSEDGRSWADSEIGQSPQVRWKSKVVWGYINYYLSDLPSTPVQKSMIPWVVENATWQSRIVLNNASDETVQVDLEAIELTATTQTRSLELAPGEVYAQNPAELFPGITRYSLFITVHGSKVFPVFQVNARVMDFLSPSQSGGLYIDTLTPNLAFPFMAGEDANAIVLVETDPLEGVTEPISLQLLNEQGEEIAHAEVVLDGRTPVAHQVVNLFQEVSLPTHFSIKATGGRSLAGTAFIFNKEGQPSMANAFSLSN